MGVLIIIALLLSIGFTWGGYVLGKPRGWHILGLVSGLFAGLILFAVHFIGGIFIGGIGLVLAATLPPTPTSPLGLRSGAARERPRASGGESQAEVMARLEGLRNQGVLTEDEYKKAVKRAIGID